MAKREERKNIHFKQIHFNPISFLYQKYSPEKYNIYKNDLITTNENEKNKNITITSKKIKLKPLEKSKNNYRIKLDYKIDKILIPSNKTSKELIDYNLSNTHNTLLNYYNKNNKNLKIFNFVKTNTFNQSQNINLTNKFLSSNESIINNNNSKPLIIENNKNNNYKENQEIILKRNIKIQKSFSETGQILNPKFRKRKSQIDAYESEVYKKTPIQYNLNYFHNYFFSKKQNESKKSIKKSNSLIKINNNSKAYSFKLSSNKKEKTKENIDEYNKNGLTLNPSPKRIMPKKLIFNNGRKEDSYKELRALSLQGYKKLKADKRRRFEQMLKNTNQEVINLEHQLDELLEVNQQILLNAD